MAEKLEQTMKKIHIYLANCKESAYSTEDIIVSKKRILGLLEELNYAVYEAMEEYEATKAARDRGQIAAERMATEIKEEAMKRAEDVYASSLLYTQESISDIRMALEYTMMKTKTEYENLIQNYEDRMQFLEQNSQEIVSQLSMMAEAKTYLHMIEEIKTNSETRDERLEEAKQYVHGKNVGSVEETTYAQEEESPEVKEADPIVVEVHDAPKIPEGFGRKKSKKKGKHIAGEDAAIQSQELDSEYFAFQEEQEKELAKQMMDEEVAEEAEGEETDNSFLGALRRLTLNTKKK